MQFYVDRNTPAVDRVRWPAKPKDTAALKPEDETILKLLEQYGCESFRVHDGWAVVHDTASTVIAFHTPIDKWEGILKTLVAL